MIAINVKDKAIRILDINKSLMGKTTIGSFSKSDIKKDEHWEEKILNVKGEVGISIPDSAVHFLRFTLAQDTSRENISALVLDHVRENLDIPLDKMIFDTAIVDKAQSNIEVIFIGIEFEKLLPYYKAWKRIGLNPVLLVPESIAYYEVLKGSVSEGQVNLFVDAEDSDLYLMFYDFNGPISSVTVDVEAEKMPEKINEAISKFEKDNEKKVSKVILSGDEGEEIECDKIRLELTCLKSRSVIDQLLQKSQVQVKDDYTSKSSFVSTIGLGLILFDKNQFNLMKKNLTDIMESINVETEDSVKDSEKIEEPAEKEEVSKKMDHQPVQEEKQGKKEEPEVIVAEKTQIPLSVKPESKKSRFLLPIVLFFLTLIIAGAGFYAYDSGLYKGVFKKVSSISSFVIKPTPIPTQIPTPTPKPITREDLKVEVLNGSGKEGAASGVADQLTKKGYKDIKTDNADNYNYTGITLRVKEKAKSLAASDLADLKITKTETLDSNSPFDLIIIVGK